MSLRHIKRSIKLSMDVDISHEEVLQMVKSESNDYCNTDWEITEQDINEESEMGDILKQYNTYMKNMIWGANYDRYHSS